MFLKQNLKTVLFIFLSFHGIYPEPRCSSYHYAEKLLEKMVRLEFLVENMRKEIENTKEQAMKTLDALGTERKSWENTLMTMKETSIQNLSDTIQETKTKVQDEMNAQMDEKEETENQIQNELQKLTEAKEMWTKELAEKNPGVVFSARNPKDTPLTNGLIMVYTEIIVNKGDGYNKENGIFTVPYTGIYMFEVQFCMSGEKYFYFAFEANDVPCKRALIQQKTNFSCYNFDAVTFVNKSDNVKVKIKSPSSGTHLSENDSYIWNTFSGALIQAL